MTGHTFFTGINMCFMGKFSHKICDSWLLFSHVGIGMAIIAFGIILVMALIACFHRRQQIITIAEACFRCTMAIGTRGARFFCMKLVRKNQLIFFLGKKNCPEDEHRTD
jgi:hypothetical protein